MELDYDWKNTNSGTLQIGFVITMTIESLDLVLSSLVVAAVIAAVGIVGRSRAPVASVGMIGAFRAGGFSPQLAHYAMHALGSRMWGFIQEVFPSPPPPEDPEMRAAMFAQAAQLFPNVIEIATVGAHRDVSGIVQGCDDQAEFEFALDLLLDGLDRANR